MKVAKCRERGSILIITLWIMTILTVLAIGIGFRVSLEMRLSRYNLDRLQARYIAKAGIVKARAYLSGDNNDHDSLYECGVALPLGQTPESIFGEENNKLGEGSFSVSYDLMVTEDTEGAAQSAPQYGIMDEERKINLNFKKFPTQNKNEFKKIIESLSDNITPEMAAAILDWQDPGSSTEPDGAESFYYESLSRPYKAKNADFEITQELLLVKGITPQIYGEIEDYITVYSDGKINVNTASERVLNAVIDAQRGAFKEVAGIVVDVRKGVDEIDGTKDDLVFLQIDHITSIPQINANHLWKARLEELAAYFVFKSANFRIRSKAVVRKAEKTIDCVVRKETTKGEKELLYYHED